MTSMQLRSTSLRSRIRVAALGGLAAGALLGPLALATTASAAVATTTGAAQVVSAPPSVAVGAFESSTAIRVFTERQVTLSAALPMWSMGANGSLVASTITVGRCVQSHLVHYDGRGTASPTLSGSATFTAPIIGVIPINTSLPVLGRPLDRTDALFAAPGTTYPAPGRTARGIELFSVDDLSYSASSPRTLGFRFGGDGFDEVRVLTNCDTPPADVPEAPLPILMSGGAAAAFGASALVRRRRHAAVRPS